VSLFNYVRPMAGLGPVQLMFGRGRGRPARAFWYLKFVVSLTFRWYVIAFTTPLRKVPDTLSSANRYPPSVTRLGASGHARVSRVEAAGGTLYGCALASDCAYCVLVLSDVGIFSAR
jgi:hypothetical protein